MGRDVGVWVVALAAAGAAAFALLMGGDTPDPVGRGTPAPDFTLSRLSDGTPVRLEDLRGRVVLVNFWATWCEPCEAEMPAMQRLHAQLEGPDFELLAISVDDEVPAVRAFRERLELRFPILLDPDERVARRYQTFRYPESFLVGPDGVIVERYVGGKEWDASAYVARIRRLMAGGVPSSAG
jgi:peroxiredoxin